MNRVSVAGLALLVLAMSCKDAVGPGNPTGALNAAHERWHAQNLHTYAFTLQRTCFCPYTNPLHVVVLSDTVAGVVDLETGATVDRQFGVTVEDLFTLVQNAIDHRAPLIRAMYDRAKGFPTAVDYNGEAIVGDGEISYRVGDVHPLAPPPRAQGRAISAQPDLGAPRPISFDPLAGLYL